MKIQPIEFQQLIEVLEKFDASGSKDHIKIYHKDYWKLLAQLGRKDVIDEGSLTAPEVAAIVGNGMTENRVYKLSQNNKFPKRRKNGWSLNDVRVWKQNNKTAVTPQEEDDQIEALAKLTEDELNG